AYSQRSRRRKPGMLQVVVFQEGLPASHMLGFRLLGGRADDDEQRKDDRDDEQKKGKGLSAALVIFHTISVSDVTQVMSLRVCFVARFRSLQRLSSSARKAFEGHSHRN